VIAVTYHGFRFYLPNATFPGCCYYRSFVFPPTPPFCICYLVRLVATGYLPNTTVSTGLTPAAFCSGRLITCGFVSATLPLAFYDCSTFHACGCPCLTAWFITCVLGLPAVVVRHLPVADALRLPRARSAFPYTFCAHRVLLDRDLTLVACLPVCRITAVVYIHHCLRLLRSTCRMTCHYSRTCTLPGT